MPSQKQHAARQRLLMRYAVAIAGVTCLISPCPRIVAAARVAPCAGGRFLPDVALVSGDAAPVTDAINLDASSRLSIGSSCGPARAKLKGSSQGTLVKSTLRCNGVRGKAKLKARFDADCSRFSGTLKVGKQKKPFSARRSTGCGDGLVDPGLGEQCEVSGDCPAGQTCAGCGCVPAPTTSTIPSTTTTTTSATATSTTTTTTPQTTTTTASSTTTTSAPPTTTTTVTTASTTTTTTQPGGPDLSIDDVSVTEGDAGFSTVTFTVTQSEPSANATTVSYTTADDTAASPGDYLAASGTVEITPGNTTAEISVTIKGDTLAEEDESLFVRLSNAVNATIGDGEGVAEVVNDDGGAPTTFELIEKALADGLIDAETALIYEVFAEFQDARLPAQYQGRDDAFFEGIAIRDAARRFSTLTPATQAILAPFLEFPDFLFLPSSPAQEAPQERARSSTVAANASHTLELVPGKIIMGWDPNSVLAGVLEEVANQLKAEFDARIKPKLTTFLGMPVAGKVFILLSETQGLPGEEKPSDDCTEARITLRKFDPWILVHELTHALLDLNFSISACHEPEKLWMHEATAHWAQHYVYPPANAGREQTAATWFLTKTERSLSAYDGTPRGHEYGAYLWFLRLAGQENNPGVVRAIWESAAGVPSLEAIESVLQASGLGGFENQWPKFALDNWNRLASEGGPYRKYYDWDKLDHKASQHEYEANLDGTGWQSVMLGYDLPILSADYQRWDFTKDENIRGILLKNDGAGNDPNASIQAIVKIRDQTWPKAEDWSNEKEHFYCRDKADEDVEEIIVVVSNRSFQPGTRIQDQGQFGVYYTALPCNDWTGSTTYHKTGPSTGYITSAEGENLRFRADLTGPLGVWKAIEGTVTLHIDETFPFEDGSCTSKGSKSFAAKDHGHFVLLWLGGNVLQFSGEEDPFDPELVMTVTTDCQSSSGSYHIVQDTKWFLNDWFETGPLRPIAFGATTLNDSYSTDAGDDHKEWTWNFVKEQ
jgi:hypothetical protein